MTDQRQTTPDMRLKTADACPLMTPDVPYPDDEDEEDEDFVGDPDEEGDDDEDDEEEEEGTWYVGPAVR
jgi:hypothetical protein